MQIHITVDLENYTHRLLAVTMDVRGQSINHDFSLYALTVGNGISVIDWQVTGGESQVDGSQIRIHGSSFRIHYSIEIQHEVHLGSDIEVEFTYPFLNSKEIFFGSGILAIPKEPCIATFQLLGLPAGWNEFSSLTPGGMHPDKISDFFCYCAADLSGVAHRYHGQAQDVKFCLATQLGKSLPMPVQALFAFIDGYLDWLEHSLFSYQRASEINILVLQAPFDFATLTNRQTFATGENVLNGIACYAPTDIDYLKNNFNYTSYSQFLYEGFAHELFHYYTTASPNGRKKSVLYPSPHCPAYAVNLIADALAIYFYSQYVSEHVPEAQNSFESRIERARLRQQKTGKRQALLDLQILDEYLRANGSSLLALFREMVRIKLHDQQPYESAKFLFDTMRKQLNISPKMELENDILAQQ